jgi:protease-4
LFLLASLGLNALLILVMLIRSIDFEGSDASLIEKTAWGPSSASDKIAVLKFDGVLMEGFTTAYFQKQIDQAGKDANVKAIVVRIDSPGGTITASDDIHRRLTQLRDGKLLAVKSPKAKPLVVSMGAMAASGGYYIAMPGQRIFAEKTTVTGSIGVYASFIDLHELADKHGVKMQLVKAGDIKGSGSMFQKMTPQERQPWQDMVDDAYSQFVKIVEDGRPNLKGKLTTPLERKDANGKPLPNTTVPRDEKGNVIADAKPEPFFRKIADGGGFTADEAKRYGLVDEIGYLDDAVADAATRAGLTAGNYKVVTFDRIPSLFNLFGGQMRASQGLDFAKLSQASRPRTWYLAPNAEVAGIFAAAAKD